jgi:uncharacterized protein YjcR
MASGKPDPTTDWHQLRLLAVQGIPLREIARRYHLSAGTVLARAKRENWQISAITNGRKVVAQPAIQKALQVSTDFIRDNGLKSRAALSTALVKAASRLESLPADEIIEKHQALEGVTRAGDRLHGWSAQDQAGSVVNIAFLNTPASALPEKKTVEAQAQVAHPENANAIGQ